MKRFSILFLVMILLSCTHNGTEKDRLVEFKYKDFGPPALAEPLIGSDYWQWQNHGDSRPKDYPIGVIVYRDMDLDQVKGKFPVIEDEEQDYRYVTYDKAIEFLNTAIKELEKYSDDMPSKLANTLKATRDTILKKPGD